VFRDYLLDFWDWDNSPYIKEKMRKKHGIHRHYVAEMKGSVARYWAPFFKDRLLGEISTQDIEDFINYLEDVAEKAESETYGGRPLLPIVRKNKLPFPKGQFLQIRQPLPLPSHRPKARKPFQFFAMSKNFPPLSIAPSAFFPGSDGAFLSSFKKACL
jgi:hypothetical protein